MRQAWPPPPARHWPRHCFFLFNLMILLSHGRLLVDSNLLLLHDAKGHVGLLIGSAQNMCSSLRVTWMMLLAAAVDCKVFR